MKNRAFEFWLGVAAIVLGAAMMVAAANGQCPNCPGGQCPTGQSIFASRGPSVNIGIGIERRAPIHAYRYVEHAGKYAAVVRIKTECAGAVKYGSGVVIRWNRRPVILTAKHVVSSCKRVLIFHPRRHAWVECTACRTKSDWDDAFLLVDIADSADLPAAEIAWGSDATPAVGTPLESCGFGQDGTLAVNDGVVIGYRSQQRSAGHADWMDITGAARQGDSGGPLLNAKGEVTGILWGTDERRVTATQGGLLHRLLAEACGPWDGSEIAQRAAIDIAELPRPFDVAQTPAPAKQPILPYRRGVEGEFQGIDSKLNDLLSRPAPSAPPVVVQPAAPSSPTDLSPVLSALQQQQGTLQAIGGTLQAIADKGKVDEKPASGLEKLKADLEAKIEAKKDHLVEFFQNPLVWIVGIALLATFAVLHIMAKKRSEGQPLLANKIATATVGTPLSGLTAGIAKGADAIADRQAAFEGRVQSQLTALHGKLVDVAANTPAPSQSPSAVATPASVVNVNPAAAPAK